MTEFRDAVSSVAGRVREASDDLDSEREVQLRAVEPLLEALGWDVRSTDVEPDVEVDGRSLDYLLHAEGTPTVAVRTVEPGAALSDDVAPTLADALRDAGLPLGIATDGARYVLLAHRTGEVRRTTADLDRLAESPAVLETYTRDAVAERLASGDALAEARGRLADRRSDAVAAVTAALVEVAGDPIEDAARRGAERLVAELAAEADDVAERAATDAPTAADGASTDDSGADAEDRASAPSGDSASTSGATAHPDSPGPAPPEVRTGEFVARFFGGRSSVGAVGTDTAGGTLAAAVQFLAENHDLRDAVTLPWGVASGRATLAAAPEHPDGSPMEHYSAVDGECYVWTGCDVERARAAVEELADAVGLRVMFQGDW